MTPLTVPAYSIANNAMPTIGTCALHGQPMVGTRKMTFKGKTPPWVWLLIVVGVLIAIIVSEAVRPKVTGLVPECERCIAERKARKRKVLVLWLSSGVLFVALLVSGQHATAAGIFALLMIVALIWALIATVRAERKGLQGTVSKDGLWVTLQVDDSHFAAVQQAMQAAQSS
jgi:hypothetical protein